MELPSSVLIVCCYFLAALYLIAAAVPCTYPNNPCVCQTNSATYNLTSLMEARGGADLIVQVDDSYTYYVQPCNRGLNSTLSLCARDLVACQVSTDGKFAYGLGAIDQFSVEGTPESFTLINWYIDADNINRRVHLAVNCSHYEGAFIYNGHTGIPPLPIEYSFTLLTRHVCKGFVDDDDDDVDADEGDVSFSVA